MTKCVIACSGEKICINDSLLFTNRCSNGNLSDYCKANEKFINKELTNGKISKLNIVIPTYNSGLKLLETIKSILIQNLKIETEIIVYINNPPNKTNDKEIIPETLKLFENINNPKLNYLIQNCQMLVFVNCKIYLELHFYPFCFQNIILNSLQNGNFLDNLVHLLKLLL